jgi:hypothetical protein
MIGVMAASASAQGRGPSVSRQGIPPGQMPPPGSCRVWYDNVPPGRQPAPTSCVQAERQAARSRNARVIYGDERWTDRVDDRRGPRAVPRSPADVRRDPNIYGRDPYVYGRRGTDQYGRRGMGGYASVPYANGYEDGHEKGREDARDRDRYEPQRHGRYSDADRGYNDRYGWSRDEYRQVYREGFLSGYDDGFRGSVEYRR